MTSRLTRRPLVGLLATPFLIAAGALPTSAIARKRSQPPRDDAPAAASRSYLLRDDAMRFADDVAERRSLNPDWVRNAIGQAQFLPRVPRLMLPPARGTAKNWRVYRSRFIDPVRIRAGVGFWQRNAATLQRAQAEFGVPPEIIVGIVGVETIYGQIMGNFRVLDALATLAFDFPAEHPRAAARQAYFQSELEQFLSLSQRSGMDPTSPLGSYAGAMGMPQFMPSSWIKYAIDYDGDGQVDLWHSETDVIGSVANYFKSYGWQTGMPTHYTVQFNPAKLDMAALMAPDILPTFTPAAMADKGAELEADALLHPGLLALVELQNGAAPPQYVAGTANFYTITRYNWSSYYAMAVIELGQEVAAAMPK
jgi:membrane-bound lytic murein transglycosylase B